VKILSVSSFRKRGAASLVATIALALSFLLDGCASPDAPPGPGGKGLTHVSEAERVAYIREAEVWSPIDTASLDLRRGPPGGTPLPADAELVCRFHVPSEQPGGRSQKLYCRTSDGKVHKIKYGVDNKEIYGEAIGARLLWALGFKADVVRPVRVRCSGCPEDPWRYLEHLRDWDDPPPVPDPAERVIEPAIVESYHAELIEAEKDQGVAWGEILELRSRDPEKAERQRIHREALTLLATLMQHADSKASNQTLGCAPGGAVTEADGRRVCEEPVIYIGDLGGAGGYGWVPFREPSLKRLVSPSKVRFDEWEKVPVWSDPEECITKVNGMPNATLGNEKISEDGRRFLAERISLLSDDQWVALIELSRVELLEEELETPGGERRPVTPEDRIEVLKRKLRQVLDHRCPPASRE
jgi:hypothetical protein